MARLSAGLLALALLAWAGAPAAAQEEQTIVAEGRADGGDTAARDRAIQDAMRKALEKAFGTFIHSQSETENFALVRDKIFAETRGFVKSYKVVSESVEGGITTVKISAIVMPAVFRGRWEAIRNMVNRKKRPRMMFLFYELREKGHLPGAEGYQTQTANGFTSKLEEKFIDNKFFCVDRRQVLKVKAGDIAAAKLQADLGKLVALAKEMNCEVVVFGHIRHWPGGTTQAEVAGRRLTFHYHNVEVVAKAVRADTGKIITSLSREYAGKSLSRASARGKGLEKGAHGYSEELMEKILVSWNEDLTNAGNVRLEVSNISFGDVVKLQNALRKIRWVGQVSPRGYAGKVQTWDIESRLSAQDVAMKLASMELPVALEITGVAQNKISGKIGN